MDVKFAYFATEEEDSAEEAIAENWKLLVTALALALTSLQPCQLRTQTDLVSEYHPNVHRAVTLSQYSYSRNEDIVCFHVLAHCQVLTCSLGARLDSRISYY